MTESSSNHLEASPPWKRAFPTKPHRRATPGFTELKSGVSRPSTTILCSPLPFRRPPTLALPLSPTPQLPKLCPWLLWGRLVFSTPPSALSTGKKARGAFVPCPISPLRGKACFPSRASKKRTPLFHMRVLPCTLEAGQSVTREMVCLTTAKAREAGMPFHWLLLSSPVLCPPALQIQSHFSVLFLLFGDPGI